MISCVGKDVEQSQLSYVAGINTKGTATLENTLAVFKKNVVTIWPSDSTLKYVRKRNKKHHVYTKSCM